MRATGDVQTACHVDCSLAGTAACPPGYGCSLERFDGGLAQLCVPDGGVCLNSEAGFCDRVSSPQRCDRVSLQGACSGDRLCQADGQYSSCNASTPQCLASCSDTAASGCVDNYCPEPDGGTLSCGTGTCPNPCPGQSFAGVSANVGCTNGNCTFSCIGENYDVNDNPSDGCEWQDSPQGDHTMGSAVSLSSLDNCGTSNIDQTGQRMLSDTRVHENPSVAGFDTFSGSAPDWVSVQGTGGSCSNDAQLTLTLGGTNFPYCYALTFYAPPYPSSPPTCDSSSAGSCTCVVDITGTCQTNPGDNVNYSNGDLLYWEVSKICDTSSTEVVAYGVSGHL